MNRKRFSLSNLVLILSSVCIGLILIEGGVRLLGIAPSLRLISLSEEGRPFHLSDNPLLGYELKKNFIKYDNKGQKNVFTNSFGLRDRERELNPSPGSIRIVLLGDSVVQGEQVFEETIAYQLEQMLNKKYTFPVEVLNFGIDGYSTQAEVELLFTKGIRFKPDLVALLFVINDFDGNEQVLNRDNIVDEPGPFSFEVWQNSKPQQWLLLHSHLYRYLVSVILRTKIDNHKTAVNSQSVDAAVARFKKLSRENGFYPVIFLWPSFDDQSKTTLRFSDDIKKIYAKMEHIANAHKIDVYHLLPHFQEDLQHRLAMGERIAKPIPFYWFDGMHPTPVGAYVGASGIMKILMNKKVLEK